MKSTLRLLSRWSISRRFSFVYICYGGLVKFQVYKLRVLLTLTFLQPSKPGSLHHIGERGLVAVPHARYPWRSQTRTVSTAIATLSLPECTRRITVREDINVLIARLPLQRRGYWSVVLYHRSLDIQRQWRSKSRALSWRIWRLFEQRFHPLHCMPSFTFRCTCNHRRWCLRWLSQKVRPHVAARGRIRYIAERRATASPSRLSTARTKYTNASY